MNERPTQHYVAAADRRAEIIAAARALIAESGFEGLRTRDIAERVGINIATLHYHVPTKAALVELLAQSLRDDFMARHAARAVDHADAREQLRREFAEFEEVRREMPQIHLVYSELMVRSRRDETVAAIMQPMIDHWHGRIAKILGDGVADGSFRPNLEPTTAATMVIGALTWRYRTGCAPDAPVGAVTAELMRSVERQKPASPGDKP
jgi:AcrR family transcriptional regulator